MASQKYVVVSPVRNEGTHLPAIIASMMNQTMRPVRWVIVDDGSSDDTRQIAEDASIRHPWIVVVSRRDRGFRKPGGGVVEAFAEGYRLVETEEWDFVVKLDGDLSFEPTYFEQCFLRFQDDSRLGIASGVVCRMRNGEMVAESVGDPAFHVRGASKIYRRACWFDISPLMPAPGWDTIDEVKANMKGWKTRTFNDVGVVQLKPTGVADGNWKNWYKNGLANYVTGYHPAFMVAKCLRRAIQRPRLVAALALMCGFCAGYVRRRQRVNDPNMIQYLRREQVKKLLMRPSLYDRPQARSDT